jgi:hypothetical protein
MCILWQRLGRSGRDGLTQAIGVLLAEKKYFNDEKAKRRAAVEAQQRKKRKLVHEALLKTETDSVSDSVENKSALLATTSQPSAIPPTPSTQPKKPSSSHKKPKKPKKPKQPRTIEAGVDQFLNSHLALDEDDQCRHRAINQYFGNPTEGEASI